MRLTIRHWSLYAATMLPKGLIEAARFSASLCNRERGLQTGPLAVV